MFTCSSFAEEGVEGVITTSDGLVTWHLSIGLDSVFEAVQLPTSIPDLTTGLSDMDGDARILVSSLVADDQIEIKIDNLQSRLIKKIDKFQSTLKSK